MHKTPRSFLINVAGRVAIFPRDPMISELEIAEQVPLCTPSVIANNVESIALYCPRKNGLCNSEYFKDSVWLMCGASGLKAWISLPFDSTSDVSSFNVKRAVFVFNPINYPLAFECNSGFLMGVDTDNLTASNISNLSQPPNKLANITNEQIPHYVLSKTVSISIFNRFFSPVVELIKKVPSLQKQLQSIRMLMFRGIFIHLEKSCWSDCGLNSIPRFENFKSFEF